MDIFEAPGFRHYRGTSVADDNELRELYVDRIYDTYIGEEQLRVCDGACSGSTLKEAFSRGKVDTTCEQMVYAEATSVLPLIAGYAYHSWFGEDQGAKAVEQGFRAGACRRTQMKATLSRAAEGWTFVPARCTSRNWNKLLVLLLLGMVLPAGCGDRGAEARQEAANAKATAAKLELMVKGARDEVASLKAELKAVKQTRDELQEQMDKIKQERDQALGLSQQAKEVITNLSARADNQAGTAASLEKQIADLKAVVQEQKKLIEELQKGATSQPAAETETSGETKDKTPPPAEPNEKP